MKYPQPHRRYTLEFTSQALEYLSLLLGQRPYVEVAALIAEIDEQIARQDREQDAVQSIVVRLKEGG